MQFTRIYIFDYYKIKGKTVSTMAKNVSRGKKEHQSGVGVHMI